MSAAACLTLSLPLFTPPVPMIHRVKFGSWSEHHCIYFLTIVLLTIVDIVMKFDPTCRQRNLSSTTALVMSYSWLCLVHPNMNGSKLDLVNERLVRLYNSHSQEIVLLMLWIGMSFRRVDWYQSHETHKGPLTWRLTQMGQDWSKMFGKLNRIHKVWKRM